MEPEQQAADNSHERPAAPTLPTVPGAPAASAPSVQRDDVSERGIASAIYGLVICSATLATASETDKIWVIAASVLVTVAVYWAAETYSLGLARRTLTHRNLTRKDHHALLVQGWPMVSASFVPILVLVVSAAVGRSTGLAVDLALLAATILLVVSGWRASTSSGLTGFRLIISVLISALLGAAMVVLKNALH